MPYEGGIKMSLSIATDYQKSLYEKDLEDSINSNLSSISANITTLSGNITALNDFINVAVSTAVFTLDLATYRNFTITNTETSAKTLKIANAPIASDTMLNVNVKLAFSATATFTYTGTITWSTATAPNPTAVGTFILNLKSFNTGTSWFASYAGLY